MKDSTIGFIGGGNMARSLIGGLLADGVLPQHIWVSDPNETALRNLQTHFAVHTTASNSEAARHAQVVVLAVKPQAAKAVAQELLYHGVAGWMPGGESAGRVDTHALFAACLAG